MIPVQHVVQQFGEAIGKVADFILVENSDEAVEFVAEQPPIRIRFTEDRHAERSDTDLGWNEAAPYLRVSIDLRVATLPDDAAEAQTQLAPLVAQYCGRLGALGFDVDSEEPETSEMHLVLTASFGDPSPFELAAALMALIEQVPSILDLLRGEHPATESFAELPRDVSDWLRSALPRYFDHVEEDPVDHFTFVQRQRDGDWIGSIRSHLEMIDDRLSIPVHVIRIPLMVDCRPEGVDFQGREADLLEYVAAHKFYANGTLVAFEQPDGGYTVILEHAYPTTDVNEVAFVAWVRSMIYTADDLRGAFAGFGGTKTVYEPEADARAEFLDEFAFAQPFWKGRVRWATVHVICGAGLRHTAAVWSANSSDPIEALANRAHEYADHLARLLPDFGYAPGTLDAGSMLAELRALGDFTRIEDFYGLEVLAVPEAAPFDALAEFAHQRGIMGSFSALVRPIDLHAEQ